MTSAPVGAGRTMVDVTIRYWASARAAAGCDSEHFAGRYVGDVLEAAAAAHTGLGAVLEVSTILMGGRPVTAAEPLPEPLSGPLSGSLSGSSSESLSEHLSESLPESMPAGTTIEVLPPFAGG